MSNRVPAEVFPPGEFLKEELTRRGWSQVELSEILGRPPRVVSEIVSAKRAITPETAKGLAAAFATSAELWMNLESSYQLSRTSFETNKVQRRAKLYGAYPVKEMIRRGWVESSKDMDELERAFCEYFSVESIDDAPTFAHAAKKSSYDDAPARSQLAWLIRAEQIASGLKVRPFQKEELIKAIQTLRGCLRSVDDLGKVPSILARAGVRFVVVKYVPGAKLDGACFWLEGGQSPVVAMSLRHDRIDNFWHTLFHELDHVLHEEGKQSPKVDIIDLECATDSNVPPEEKRANETSANCCIDRDLLEQWIVATAPVFSRREIVSFADKVNVHPALVLGQLQYRGLVKYSFHRDLLESVRHVLVESIETDGFEGIGGT